MLVGLIRRGSTLNSGFANSWLWCDSMFTRYLLLVKDEEEEEKKLPSRDDLEYSKKVRETCVTLVEIHFFIIHNFLTSSYPKISPISFKDI